MNNIYSIPTNSALLAYNNKPGVFKDFERIPYPETHYAAYNPEINNRKRKARIIKAAIVSVVIGAALSLASSRVRVNLAKLLESVSSRSENIIKNSAGTIQKSDVPIHIRMKIAGLRAFNRVTSSALNFVGNIDHGKNCITGKVVDNVPVVDKVVRYLNGKLKPLFTGTVKKASYDKYKAAENAAASLQETLQAISTGTPQAKAILGSAADDVARSLSKLTERNNFDARYGELDSLIKKAVQQYNVKVEGMVANNNIAKATSQMLEDTISLKIAQENLLKRNKDLLSLKHAISFSNKEKMSTLNQLLSEITVMRGQKPDPKLVQKLQEAILSYGKSATGQTTESLLGVLKEASQTITNPEIARTILKAEKAVTTTKIGAVQQLLEKLKTARAQGLINAEQFEKASSQALSLQQKLDKAVSFETTNLSGRLLDLNIGPTPLLETASVIIPAGVVAHETMADAENNQERISKLIRFGPSVVGGVGATVFALQKGLFGVRSLGFGLLSGIALNKIGNFVDANYYSKGREFNTMKILSSDKQVKPGVKIVEV